MSIEERRAKQSAYHRKWREAHKEGWNAYMRRFRANHPGYDKARKRDPVVRAATQRAYARAHPEKVNARNQNYRAQKANALGSYSAAEFKVMCEAQGGKCAICKKQAKLTADHITPLARGGSNLIVNIQGLCLSCNTRKHAKIEIAHQFNLWDRVA